MAKNDKVMAMVERTLKRKPDASTEELYEKAKKINKQIGKLTLRQFNARYPLQVKRRQDGKSKRRRRSRSAPKGNGDTDRRAVRKIFLEFAKDLAGAENKGEVVDVVASVDQYVDRVVKAVG